MRAAGRRAGLVEPHVEADERDEFLGAVLAAHAGERGRFGEPRPRGADADARARAQERLGRRVGRQELAEPRAELRDLAVQVRDEGAHHHRDRVERVGEAGRRGRDHGREHGRDLALGGRA